jgi:Uma2 family endonuclease
MEMHEAKLYTVDEFEAIADAPENADRLLELINGEIVEKMPTELYGFCVINVGTELNLYARRTKPGRVVTEVTSSQTWR